MKKPRLPFRCLILILLCICLCTQSGPSALALAPTTLYNGCRGEEVRELQQALIDLGYLGGTADGIFGNNTERAVRSFQKANRLSVDGLAGKTTRRLILSKAEAKSTPAAPAPAPSEPTAVPAAAPTAAPSSSGSQSSSLFGTYTTIRAGNRGDRVKTLQQSLITLGYLSGKADGIFGNQTKKAVKAFQRNNHLTADGVAGKKTLTAILSALSGGSSAEKAAASPTAASPAETPSPSAVPTATPAPEDGELNAKISAPGSVQLLHWFNDVKPSISGGQRLLVYDPSSGLSWTLRVLSRGRHCDAEPLTAQDTRTMVAAFGGINTWNQKAVYVKLPDGRWTLASTHDMPHQTGSVKDNNFNGHLCVHFLRDMDEARQNDPNYGVANQETIRAKWKQMTGEDVP